MTVKPPPVLSLFTAAPDKKPGPAAPKTARSATKAERPPGTLTVSEVLHRARVRLEELGDISVVGEVQRLTTARNGHWYLELKDKGGCLSVVMYFRDVQRVRFTPEAGLEVVVTGRLTVYPATGRFQLLGKNIAPVGQGALALAFEQLKQKLEAQGLFDVARKRALPFLPQRVGIVTSLQAAALHDVLRVLRARMPQIPVLVAQTRVQGEGAGSEVAQALRLLDQSRRCDVILLVRGGGSMEDLWAFNTEPVARAIFHSETPIICGVGHETDTTIADLVADVRAATPSQAAELAVPREVELRARLDAQGRRLTSLARGRIEREKNKLLRLERRLPTAARLKRAPQERLHVLVERLERASPQARLVVWSQRVGGLQSRLMRVDPRAEVARARARTEAAQARLQQAVRRLLEDRRHRLLFLVEKLDALSPLAVLRRGFALVTSDQDDRLARADDLRPGARLRVRLEHKTATVVVQSVEGGERVTTED